MARVSDLKSFGEMLRRSNINEISTAGLYKLLIKHVGSMTKSTLKRYIKTLEGLGYIRFENYKWKVIRPKQKSFYF